MVRLPDGGPEARVVDGLMLSLPPAVDHPALVTSLKEPRRSVLARAHFFSPHGKASVSAPRTKPAACSWTFFGCPWSHFITMRRS